MHRRDFALGLGAALLPGCRVAAPPVPAPPGASAGQGAALRVGGCAFTLVPQGHDPLPLPLLRAWVERAAGMIADYYRGEFPVPGLQVTLIAGAGRGVGFGSHQDGRWVRVHYGRHSSAQHFERDWVMVHELLHATFPDLPDHQRWMQEGLSTYLEPIVRVRGGATTEARMWQRWLPRMHHGRPQSGDEGLDRTHTWGRTYWGGTLFWLMVDLQLRIATEGQRSIRDVVVAIARAGGNGRASWNAAQVCEHADAATQTTLVSTLYDQLARNPGDVDLDALWSQLGVSLSPGDAVAFDDGAPLAALRRALVRA